MNYLPFTVTKVIHEERIEQSLTYHRRHNDGFMPQPALMPDPIGLLSSQIHSVLDRIVVRKIRAIFHAVPVGSQSGTSSLTVDPEPQPLANAVAKQAHNEAVTDEIEENNVTGYLSRRIYG